MLQIEVARCVDLSAGNARQRVRVSRLRMTRSGWSDPAAPAVTQQLGRAAVELGIEALLVPSAVRRRDANIVVFQDVMGRRDILWGYGLV